MNVLSHRRIRGTEESLLVPLVQVLQQHQPESWLVEHLPSVARQNWHFADRNVGPTFGGIQQDCREVEHNRHRGHCLLSDCQVSGIYRHHLLHISPCEMSELESEQAGGWHKRHPISS